MCYCQYFIHWMRTTTREPSNSLIYNNLRVCIVRELSCVSLPVFARARLLPKSSKSAVTPLRYAQRTTCN